MSVGTFREYLRSAGYKLTSPREAVLSVMEREKGHLHPVDILRKARAIHPKAGRATVYRTLEILRSLNLVRPIYTGNSCVSYARVEGGHHHLICSKCDKVIEFEECEACGIENRLSSMHGFAIQSHLLEFYGHCRDCRE